MSCWVWIFAGIVILGLILYLAWSYSGYGAKKKQTVSVYDNTKANELAAALARCQSDRAMCSATLATAQGNLQICRTQSRAALAQGAEEQRAARVAEQKAAALMIAARKEMSRVNRSIQELNARILQLKAKEAAEATRERASLLALERERRELAVDRAGLATQRNVLKSQQDQMARASMIMQNASNRAVAAATNAAGYADSAVKNAGDANRIIRADQQADIINGGPAPLTVSVVGAA